MALYIYKAYDQSGAKTEGQVEAKDQKAALFEVKKQGLLPTEVSELKAEKGNAISFSNKVSLADLEFLTSELSLLLESGVRIDKNIKKLLRNRYCENTKTTSN